jgi:hypothetical protein
MRMRAVNYHAWHMKIQRYRIEGEGGGEVSGAWVNSPLIVRCRLEALLAGLPQQRVQLLPLSYHLYP